jgi:tRNA-2-methylthio-N6-dimethylallyladenosine synthase
MSGRARDNRLVHFTPHPVPQTPAPHTPVPHTPAPHTPVPHIPGAQAAGVPRPGDVVTVTVTRAAPHYLLSDAAPLSLRRTRAGDAWEAATAASAPAASAPAAPAAPAPASPAAAAPVLLGMPAAGPRD